MKEFIIQYWRLILEGCAVVVSCVLFIVRKRPIKIVDSLKEMIRELIPVVICAAEKTELKGQDKVQYVITGIYELLVKRYLSYEDYASKYGSFVSAEIEKILTTPQKKGVNL